MQELTQADAQQFLDRFQAVNGPLEAASCEAFERLLQLGSPTVAVVPIEELILSDSSALQVSTSFDGVAPDEAVIAVTGPTAAALHALLTGADASDVPPTLTEGQEDRLAGVMSGIAQGIAQAIAGDLGRSVQAGAMVTTHGRLTLPPAFAAEGEALVVEYQTEGDELLGAKIKLVFTPAFVRAYVSAAEGTGADTASAADSATNTTVAMPVAQMPPIAESGMYGTDDGQGLFALPGGLFAAESSDPAVRGIELVLDIPLDVTVELGRTRMLIKDILALASGSIVELERVAGEPIDVLVNGCLVAKGEVVVIDDNYGIRVTEIIGQTERLTALGARR